MICSLILSIFPRTKLRLLERASRYKVRLQNILIQFIYLVEQFPNLYILMSTFGKINSGLYNCVQYRKSACIALQRQNQS